VRFPLSVRDPERMRSLLVATVLAIALAPVSGAGGLRMLVGAVENSALQPTDRQAIAKVALARQAGLSGAIRVGITWARGTASPSPETVADLRDAARADADAGAVLYPLVYPYGSSRTQVSDADQQQFVGWVVALAKALPAPTTSSSATSRT
jgi:hypothetical protein